MTRHNKTSQATPVFAFLLFLNQIPGAPECFRSAKRCVIVVLTIGLLLVISPAKAETIYFLVAVPPAKLVPGAPRDTYVLPLSNQTNIDYARHLASLSNPMVGGENALITANVVAGKDGINRNYGDPGLPEWSWHVSEFLEWSFATIEILDGSPTFLEKSRDWSQFTEVHEIGFWAYTVVRELGPTPLFMSIMPEDHGLGLYWTAPGTNTYAYTVEGVPSVTSTNWVPLPGAEWPLITNHWTVTSPGLAMSFYRVRAEPALR